MKSVETYWWPSKSNFGDWLAPLLLSRFSHVVPAWAPPSEARLFTVGSVLEDAQNAVVVGSGKLYSSTVPHGSNIYLAVRGPLTRAAINYGPFAGKPVPVGDPGLLAMELVRPKRRIYQLGILPHWSDTELATRPDLTKWKHHVIDPTGDPLEVVEQIGMCHKVVTSSLHGAIVADAFNIPRRIEKAPRFAAGLEGGMFKFMDYNRSVSVETKFGVTQRASLQDVETLQHVLYDIYETLEDYL